MGLIFRIISQSLIIPWLLFLTQSGVHHALNPDPYRGVFGSDGEKYARDVQDLIEFGTSGNVAAFMSEAIQVYMSSTSRSNT